MRYLILIGLLLVSACASSPKTSIDSMNVLNVEDCRPSGDLDIYFPGQSIPKKYDIISYIVGQSNGSGDSEPIIMEQMRTKAWRLCADAIVFLNSESNSRYTKSSTDAGFFRVYGTASTKHESATFSTIRANAIVYK